MKFFKLLFIFTLSALLFTSCGQKKEGKTSGTIIIGGGVSIPQLGGVKLYGRNDFGVVFSKTIDLNSPLQLELPNGLWDFAAVGWVGGSGNMTGLVRCGTTDNVPLNGGEITVALSISQSGCSEGLFGPSFSKTGISQPRPLTFKTCVNEEALHGDPSSNCIRGNMKSYKVILPDFAVGPGVAFNAAHGLKTVCFDDPTTGAASPDADSVFNVPAFGPQAEVPIPTVIRGFENTGCTGNMQEYIFMQGLSGESYNTSVDYDNGKIIVTLLNDEFCQGAALTNSPFALTLGPTNYICTAAQFNEIETSGTMSDTFILADYIDMTSVTPNYIGASAPFTGVFDGNFKEIENWTATDSGITFPAGIGIFAKINNPAEIRDLYVSNASITCTLCDDVGLLVGYADGAGSPVDIRNVTVKNSTMNVTCSATQGGIGSIVGYMTNGTKVEESNILSNTITVGDECVSTGGMIGYLNGAGAFTSLRSGFGSGVVINTTGANGTDVGGLVGTLDGASADISSVANDLFTINTTKTYTGGIVGTVGTNARINQAVAQGTITITGGTTGTGGIIGRSSGSTGTMNRNLLSNVVIDYTTGSPGQIGGVVGVTANTSAVIFDNVMSAAAVTGTYSVGGAFGSLDPNTTVVNSGTYSPVTCNASGGNNIGGFAGESASGTLNKIFAGGDVVVTTGSTGVSRVGGLIGYQTAGALTNAYSLGNVTGLADTSETGALLGHIDSAPATADKVFYRGSVFGATGGNNNDGVGIISAGASVTNCFEPIGKTDANCAAIDQTIQGNYTTFSFGPLLDWTMDPSGLYAQLTWLNDWNSIGGFVTGSPLDPIEISTAAQLDALGNKIEFMDKTILLTANIDLTSIGNFTPIGDATNKFKGNFIGDGFTISNLTIGGASANRGLFGFIGSDSTSGGGKVNSGVRVGDRYNPFLYLSNVNINTSGNTVGALAAAVSDSAGGQYEAVEIRNVIVTSGSVSGGGTTGGLIGSLYVLNGSSKIESLKNHATVTGAGLEVAGIIAKIETGSTAGIRTLVNYGDITNSTASAYTGGIVGYGRGAGNIEEVANFGDISGYDYVGGIVGQIDSAITIDTCINAGNTISATNAFVGGILGESSAAYTISNCYAVDSIITGGAGSGGGMVGVTAAATGGVLNSYTENITISGGLTGDEFLGGGSFNSTANSFSIAGVQGTTARSAAQLRSPILMGGLGNKWTLEAGKRPKLSIADFLFGPWEMFEH